jgi:hypothetical protein
LVAALAEMYVQGVSTRKVKAITEELCGHSFSASAISAINQRLDASLGTDGSNPASSSAESVSAVNSRAVGEKPRTCAPVSSGRGTREGDGLAEHRLI